MELRRMITLISNKAKTGRMATNASKKHAVQNHWRWPRMRGSHCKHWLNNQCCCECCITTSRSHRVGELSLFVGKNHVRCLIWAIFLSKYIICSKFIRGEMLSDTFTAEGNIHSLWQKSSRHMEGEVDVLVMMVVVEGGCVSLIYF